MSRESTPTANDDGEGLDAIIFRAFWTYLAASVDARQAAAMLGLSLDSVYRLRRAGQLTAAPLPCGCARFSPDEVTRLARIRAEKAHRAAARACAGKGGRYGQQS